MRERGVGQCGVAGKESAGLHARLAHWGSILLDARRPRRIGHHFRVAHTYEKAVVGEGMTRSRVQAVEGERDDVGAHRCWCEGEALL
jgi:hypothetical protein